MSALGNKVVARFEKVAKSTAHLDDDDSMKLAACLRECLSQLLAFGSFCTAPNVLADDVAEAVIRRWLIAAIDLRPAAQLLRKTKGDIAAVEPLSTETQTAIYQRVRKIAAEVRQMPVHIAEEIALHVAESSSAFYALYEACMACDKRRLQDLGSILRYALSEPLERIISAKKLYCAKNH